MKKKEAEKYLKENFDTFRPDNSSETKGKVVFSSHGDHTVMQDTPKATMEPTEGISLNYLGPHGYDLGASIQYPYDFDGNLESFTKADQGPGLEDQWHNYKLTSFTSELDMLANPDDLYQKIANDNGVSTIKLKPGKESTTEQLLTALEAVGYDDITCIHCRGNNGMESELYFPYPGNNPNEMEIPLSSTEKMLQEMALQEGGGIDQQRMLEDERLAQQLQEQFSREEQLASQQTFDDAALARQLQQQEQSNIDAQLARQLQQQLDADAGITQNHTQSQGMSRNMFSAFGRAQNQDRRPEGARNQGRNNNRSNPQNNSNTQRNRNRRGIG